MHGWSERIALRHAAPAPCLARLREPRGEDERALLGVDTRAALQLLQRLLVAPGIDAARLGAADRDAALAALHRALWGDRISASLDCGACGAPYDLEFRLSELQRQLLQAAEPSRVEAPGVLRDAQGLRWQLPCADDEEAAAQLGLEAGRTRLHGLVGGDPQADTQAAGERLEALAPLLDVELDAPCA